MSDIFEICGIENDKIIEQIKKKAEVKSEADVAEMRKSHNLQKDINCDRRWDIIKDIPVTSHRKMTGKIIVGLKNKTVKAYKWYVDKLFDQQVEFNHTVWASFYEMKKEIDELKKEVEKLKESGDN